MADEEKPKKERGARGGIKHQPGRDHDRKSASARQRRFTRKAVRKRKAQQEVAKKAWEEWDKLSEDVKRLLGPAGEPKMPRPSDDD